MILALKRRGIKIQKLIKFYTTLFVVIFIIFQLPFCGLYKNLNANSFFGSESDTSEPLQEPLISLANSENRLKRPNSHSDIPKIRTHSEVRNELVKNAFKTIANIFLNLFNKCGNCTAP